VTRIKICPTVFNAGIYTPNFIEIRWTVIFGKKSLTYFIHLVESKHNKPWPDNEYSFNALSYILSML